MEKKWMNVVVGIVLVSMLAGGLTWIIKTVNSDMQLPELDNQLAARGLEVAQQNGCIAFGWQRRHRTNMAWDVWQD